MTRLSTFLEATAEHLAEPVLLLDRDGRVDYANPPAHALLERFGTPPFDTHTLATCFTPSVPGLPRAWDAAALRGSVAREEAYLFADGPARCTVRITAVPPAVPGDDRVAVHWTGVDPAGCADGRRQSDLYAALCAVNRAAAAAIDRDGLLSAAARVIVEVGPFELAWFGWANPQTLRVDVVARAGDTTGYLDAVRIYVDERPEGCGPTGTSIRARRPVTINDFLADPRTAPWHAAAARTGWRSATALPLVVGGASRGALTVYAREAGFFGPGEIGLLEEAAATVSAALERLDAEHARRAAEAAQREALAFSQGVIDALSEQICVLDGEGTILAVNRAWRDFAGCGMRVPRTLVGDNYLTVCDAVTGPDAEYAREAAHGIREVCAGRVAQAAIEYPFPTPERERWFMAHVAGFPGEGPARVVVTHIDITARVTSQAALADAATRRLALEAQLAQAQKLEAVGRLAGGVAHDVNNMLGVIMGHADLALTASEPGAVREGLDEILAAANRSADLTRQLLAFARRQTVRPRPVDLNQTVSGMLKMLQRLLGESIELSWTPGHGVGRVLIDPTQVDQVLANLLVNARDAMPRGGTIQIATASETVDDAVSHAHGDVEPGAYVSLSVTDCGHGMPREMLDQIFEPFFTTKAVGAGTGLGLSTVYGIVKQNRGFIEVDSEPGRGTTFTLHFPQLPGGAAAHADAEEQAGMPRGRETVLLVEDAPQLLALAESMLARLGYTVLAAGTPAAALERAAAHGGTIDLLLTDVVMPGMNGRELARALAAQRPGLRCLYASGYSASVIERGAADEPFHFIGKPYSFVRFARAVRTALDAPPVVL